MVWIQGDEIHNKFERGPHLRGHDCDAIGVGQKAEFDMMTEKQSTPHPRHGGIDCVSLKL